MQRFFDRADTEWRRPSGCLHFYALPAEGEQLRRDFRSVSSALSTVPGLGRMPEEYLHVTVQRLDAYADDLDDPEWVSTLDSLGPALGLLPGFEVRFAPPTVRSHAVEAVGGLSLHWSALVATIRQTLADAGLRQTLTASPYAPHYTVSYCIEETDDAVIRHHLSPAAKPTAMGLSSVSLVAVDQDREAGVFRFETIREWALGH
ncbi:hypothetical protein [Herbiconiux sp. A18JL235]|uniref:2'-5' RNA ligase family protein n=1 Tax=Herbiconiux sp. A18JL235 TaxID=3152363 RepID=A0AB39BIE6_9MICO